MSVREVIAEARVVLDHSLTANPVVRGILLRRAERLLARAEVLLDAGMESMPEPFVDAVLNQRPGDPPRVIAEFPEMTREEFIGWKAANMKTKGAKQ
jgi:hypothetical protein